MRKVRYFKYGNKVVPIKWKAKMDGDGFCTGPGADQHICIREKLRGKRLLSVLIDEAIHGCDYCIRNDRVDRMSDAIADLLWRAGYRCGK